MRKTILTLMIALISLVMCRAQSDFVILKDQSTVNELIQTFKILPDSTTASELSDTEFKLVEKILKECVANYNHKIDESFKKRREGRKETNMYQIRELKNYKIQYVPYLNEKGEKEVWINGFCSDFDIDWKKNIVYVFDGGNCYFTIRLNLSTGKCLAIGINGYS